MLNTEVSRSPVIGPGGDFKRFYDIWAWRPSWSCDHHQPEQSFVFRVQIGPTCNRAQIGTLSFVSVCIFVCSSFPLVVRGGKWDLIVLIRYYCFKFIFIFQRKRYLKLLTGAIIYDGMTLNFCNIMSSFAHSVNHTYTKFHTLNLFCEIYCSSILPL